MNVTGPHRRMLFVPVLVVAGLASIGGAGATKHRSNAVTRYRSGSSYSKPSWPM